jgi:signal transduction histidine kinase
MVFALVTLVAVIVLSSDSASSDDVIGQTIRLSVTLLIPAGILIGYWYIVQRQVTVAKSDLQARLAAERDVMARVSHQLRDQLTVIYGFSETLLDSDLTDQTEIRDIVTVINAEAVDLSRVVDDLVSAAELQTNEFDVSLRKFDPSIEVERAVLPFRRRAHEISVDCWSGNAVSDPIRFRQIVRNLLSNAIRHGGPQIAFVGELSNDSFRCTVADDGEGMNPALEGRLFGPSADSAPGAMEVEGIGIGLTVSRAIARQLGGHLTYQRTSDLTMVTLVLPTSDWPDLTIDVPPAGTSSGNADESAEAISESGDGVLDHSDQVVDKQDDAQTSPEPDGDIDHDGQGDEPIAEVDEDAPEIDQRITFDEADGHEPIGADDDHKKDKADWDPDEEVTDRRVEAEDVVEAPASSS